MNGFLQILETIPAVSQRRLERGEVLFRQGDPGHSLYCVLHGRLRVLVKNGDAEEKIVAEIGRGEAVGELSVLTGQARSATIVAQRDTELLECSKELFEDLISKEPASMLTLTRLIVSRLQQTLQGNRPDELPATIAVLPAGSDKLPPGFAKGLAQHLSSFGPVLHLNSASLPKDLPRPDDPEGESRLVRWLNEQESCHKHVVYETDSDPNTWSLRCIRQADRVLLAGNLNSSPQPGPVEQLLWSENEHTRPRSDLVLFRSPDKSPSGTMCWLEKRPLLFSHHHLRKGDSRDMDSLARKMAGKTLGLALGGGGARGLGHIGLIRAIQELGMPVDQIGGTSMGSIISSQFAQGRDWEEMVRQNRRWLANNPWLKDITFPSVSLIGGRRFVALLKGMFGDRQIEDLPLNCFCVSCNLTRATVRVHRTGPLWHWVLISISVPGIGPPYIENGELFVDGGVLNNLPVDVVKSLVSGQVIASDASPEVDLALKSEFKGRPFGLKALAHRWWSKDGAAIPGISDVLVRTAAMSSVYTQNQLSKLADVHVKLPVAGVKLFDWHRIDELVEKSYRHSFNQICAWKRSEE